MNIGIWLTLSQGFVAIIDREDAHLAEFKWSASVKVRADGTKRIYAVREARGKRHLLHQVVAQFKGVDHRDGDGLNNRRTNLRWANAAQNGANRPPKAGRRSSPWKGVVFLPKARVRPWRAEITRDGKTRQIGCFRREYNAAQAYNFAAAEAFGEFAYFNQPQEKECPIK